MEREDSGASMHDRGATMYLVHDSIMYRAWNIDSFFFISPAPRMTRQHTSAYGSTTTAFPAFSSSPLGREDRRKERRQCSRSVRY